MQTAVIYTASVMDGIDTFIFIIVNEYLSCTLHHEMVLVEGEHLKQSMDDRKSKK